MILLTTTPQILSATSLLPSDSPLRSSASTTSNNDYGSALPTSLDTPISHKTLISLSKALCALQQTSAQIATTEVSNKYTLNTLLHQCRPYHPPLPLPPQPSASYLALKTRLLAEQEQREYDALLQTSNNLKNTSSLASLTSSSDSDSDDISPSLILNILLSIILCAFAVFYATRYWANDGVRVLLALGVGILVGVAEVVVYEAYLRNVGLARKREARRREKKVVMSVEEVGGRESRKEREMESVDRDKNRDGEMAEIWGKGINGGVRRRVRERWEKEREREREEEEEKNGREGK
jgi:TMEM199 family protein